MPFKDKPGKRNKNLLSLLKGADRLINIALIDDDMDFHPVFCRHVENFFGKRKSFMSCGYIIVRLKQYMI